MNSSTEQAEFSPPTDEVGEAWGNIPDELKAIPQWAVADRKKKIPLQPGNLRNASVDNSHTWGTFQQAVAKAEPYGLAVGFMLTEDDPFTIIDLDDKASNPASDEEKARHQKILETFDSYTEQSVSGRGYHIIVKGRLPRNVKRDHVELYSSGQFLLCTGDSFDASPKPIAERQDLLDTLFDEMGGNLNGTKAVVRDEDETASDEEIIDWLLNADNAAKAARLWEGDLTGYPSQSEADQALMNMLRFYTKNFEQGCRLFRQSELGKRDKAQRDDYLRLTWNRAADSEPPPVDLSQLSTVVAPPPVSDTLPPLDFPPGLMGEIAQYIYGSSQRPNVEVAIAASIALMAGISGRYYNVSGSGLNLYTILLAGTGVGKEGGKDGITRLLVEVRNTVPDVIEKFMGPAHIASGQALLKNLQEQQCFVSVLGEFGITLKQISSPKANNAEIMIKKVLLDVYSKSGASNMLFGMIYSDREKNTQSIDAPSVSILGESTPENFYGGLDSSHISEGLIPRFLVLESKALRPPRNKEAGVRPSESIINGLSGIVDTVLDRQHKCAHQPLHEVVQEVAYAPEAEARLGQFDVLCDQRINADGADVEKELWNRAHLNALRLAALVAVGESPLRPVISLAAAEWAIDVVKRSVQGVAKHFRQGDIGDHDTKRRTEVLRLMDAFSALPTIKKISYGCQNKAGADQPVVPYKYLVQRTSNLSAFKSHRLGSAAGLKETLAHMVDSGEVQKIGARQLKDLGITNTRANFYTKG